MPLPVLPVLLDQELNQSGAVHAIWSVFEQLREREKVLPIGVEPIHVDEVNIYWHHLILSLLFAA